MPGISMPAVLPPWRPFSASRKSSQSLLPPATPIGSNFLAERFLPPHHSLDHRTIRGMPDINHPPHRGLHMGATADRPTLANSAAIENNDQEPIPKGGLAC